jgi:hypothetical protein
VNASRHVQLSPDRFYWAVLDAGGLPKSIGGPSRDQLGYLFESQLPLPIDQVHAIYEHASGGRYLACGMDREALRCASVEALSLSPAALPEFIEGRGSVDLRDGKRLNLLTGDFTPPHVRSQQRRWTIQVAAIMLAILAVIVGGIERRRAALLRGSQDVRMVRASLIDRLIGPLDPRASQPPDLLMTAELRRLQRTRLPNVPPEARPPEAPEAGPPEADASTANSLAALLAIWPPGIHTRTQSLVVTEESISLRVDVPSSADAESFIAALQLFAEPPGVPGAPGVLGFPGPTRPAGWSLSQPAVSADKDGVTIDVNFTRSRSGA